MLLIVNPYMLAPPDHSLQVDYLGTYNLNTSAPFTFANCSFGVPSAHRRIYVIVYINAEPSTQVSGVTIGGVAATLEVQNTGGNGHALASIWSVDMPTGVVGDVVVSYGGGSVYWAGIDVYGVSGWSQEVTATYNTAFSAVNVPAGGVGIYGFSMAWDVATDDVVWSGAVRDVFVYPGPYHRHSAAHFSSATDAQYHQLSVTGTGPYGLGYVGISIAPVGGIIVNYPTATGDIVFRNSSDAFSAILELHDTANVLWTYANGTSTSLTPVIAAGAGNTITLSVNPWERLKTINIGYGENDGATYSMTHLAAQNVTAANNLLVAKNLAVFAADGVQFTEPLVFDGLGCLHTIECYHANIPSISLGYAMPSLSRLCMEQSGIAELNISNCPLIADIRGAVNPWNNTAITIGDVGSQVWHLCVRDSNIPSVGDLLPNLPKLRDFWVWNTGLHGNISFANTVSLRSVMCEGNENLTGINVAGGVNIYQISLIDCGLQTAAIDSVLAQLDATGSTGQNIWLTGVTMGAPSANGLAHIASLEGRGWTVSRNT